MCVEERVRAHQDCAGSLSDKGFKGCLDFIAATGIEDQYIYPESARRGLSFAQYRLSHGCVVRVDEHSD